MTSLAFVYYLLELYGSIGTALVFITFTLGAVILWLGILIVIHMDDYGDYQDPELDAPKKLIKRLTLCVVALLTILTVAPSKTTLAIIVGSNYADDLIEKVEDTPEWAKVRSAINIQLDKLTGDIND